MENILFKYESSFKKQIDKAKSSLAGPKAEQYKKLTTRYNNKLTTRYNNKLTTRYNKNSTRN